MNLKEDAWIQTYSGGSFNVFYPKEEEVNIEDIAHSLSLQVRFNGHVKEFYSVAEHCIHVASLVEDKYKLDALLHDASETYTTDIPSPIKRCLPQMQQIEKNIEKVIAERFNIDFPIPIQVKEADRIMLATEMELLMSKPPKPWYGLGIPVNTDIIQCWNPSQAKIMFLKLWKELNE